jgi:hypothetical protein
VRCDWFSAVLSLCFLAQGFAAETVVKVADDASLRAALRGARPGTRIRIAAGRYAPGVYVANLQGTAQQPIVIEGAEASDPPLFEGGAEAWHLSDCAYVTLRNVAVRGQRSNGINVDDGGSYMLPTWGRRETTTPSSFRASTTSWSATVRSRAGADRPPTWSAATAD